MGVLVAVAALHAWPVLRHVGASALRDASAPRPDAEDLRRGHWGVYYDQTLFLRRHTPPHAVVVLPDGGRLGNRGLTDYFLFPRLTRHVGALGELAPERPVYRVSREGDEPLAPGPEDRVGPGGIRLRALQPGVGAWREPPPRDFTRLEPGVRQTALALGKLLLLLAAGAGFAQRFFRERTAMGFLATAFLMAPLPGSLLFLALGALGARASEMAQMALLVPLGVWGLARTRVPLRRWVGSWRRAPASGLGAGALVALFFAHQFYTSATRPILTWDACAIWGIKAKAIDAFGSWSHLEHWGAWPEYPPLLPTFMAQLAFGGEPVVKLLFPLFAFALYAMLREELVRVEVRPALATLLPLLLLLCPELHRHSTIAYANLALTAYVTKALTLLVRLRREDAFAWPGLALVLAGVAWVRPDGDAYLALLVLLALVEGRDRRGSPVPLGWLALPLAAALAWKLYFVIHLRPDGALAIGVAPQGLHFVKLALTTWPSGEELAANLRHFAVHALHPRHWGLVPLAFVALLVLRGRRALRRHRTEVTVVAASAAGLLLLSQYIGAEWGFDYYYDVTFLRLYMAVVPTMLWVVLEEIAAPPTDGSVGANDG